MSKHINLLRIFYWLLVSLSILLAIITILSTNPFNLKYKLYSVQSGSMKPTIYTGDLIIIQSESDYNVGDVITFNTGQEAVPITHRIIEKNDNIYTTKGDFNSVADLNKVNKDQVIGKYIFRIPLLGYVITFVRTVPGFILLIVIPLTIVIYEEINNIRNEIKKRRKVTSPEEHDQASAL